MEISLFIEESLDENREARWGRAEPSSGKLNQAGIILNKHLSRLVEGYSAVEFLQLGRAGVLVWAVTITACIFFDGICV